MAGRPAEAISTNVLGVCDRHGPCEDMRQALKGGYVQRIDGKLYLGTVMRLEHCILCHGALKLEPANIACWRWDQLRALPEPRENEAA